MAHFGKQSRSSPDTEKKISRLRQENGLATTDKNKANTFVSQLAETF